MPGGGSIATLWHIELLGGLRVVGPERVITRFRSRQTGALLAYLAFYVPRAHARELLMEAIWPGEALDAARDRLRVALSSLRRQLEPPGITPGSVVIADRRSVQLNPAAVTIDVVAFEEALRSARREVTPDQRARWLAVAVDRYRGELLCGHHESWIQPERQRLADLSFQAARELIHLREKNGDLSGALDLAGRAVAADPLREEAHQELIRLYRRAGQPARARRQFRELQRLLHREWGETPSPATEQLLRESDPPEAPFPKPAGSAARGQPEEEPPTPSVVPISPTPSPPLPLPLSLTRFFGREAELSTLEQWLGDDDVRLVTLTGPGGSGKSRLALEVARRLAAARPAAVWWVPLVHLTDPGLIVDAVRDAMRLPRLPKAAALEQVTAALTGSHGPALLVLDNFEHLVESGARVAGDLLERVPNLQCLVTSRQLLNLSGERGLPVEPLPVPGVPAFRRFGMHRAGQDQTGPTLDRPGAGPAASQLPPAHPANLVDPAFAGSTERLDALAACPSVRLFVDRAQASRPDFQVTAANAATVAELCRRLEGIPLAIELAAARIQMLTPLQMLPLLARRFDVLISHQRDRPARHRTLRAAIDWSYRLLSPELQQFFARLSVFRGGWTLEAAASICLDEGVGGGPPEAENSGPGDRSDPTDPANPAPGPTSQRFTPHPQRLTLALEALAHLQQSSLVVAEASGGAMRCRMLETLREYAAEQLATDERDAVARRHARYFSTLVKEAALGASERDQQRLWTDRIEREHDNIRATLDWYEASGEIEPGLGLAVRIQAFWSNRGYEREGLARLLTLLALPGSEGTAARAWALTAAGAIANEQGDLARARALQEESLALARERADPQQEARTLNNLGCVLATMGEREAAVRCWQQFLNLARQLDNRSGVAVALANLAVDATVREDWAAAEELAEQCVAISREIGSDRILTDALNVLGDVARKCGAPGRARAYHEESLAIGRQRDNKTILFRALDHLARLAREQADVTGAKAAYRESLAICRDLGRPKFIAGSLKGLGWVAAAEGEARRAVRLFAAARSLYADPDDRDADAEGTFLPRLRAELGEAGFAAAWEEGRRMPPDEIVTAALSDNPVD